MGLRVNPFDRKDGDVGSPDDDVGDEIDGESDVDFDVDDRGHDEQDLILNSSDNDDSETLKLGKTLMTSLMLKMSLLGRINCKTLNFFISHNFTDMLCYTSG